MKRIKLSDSCKKILLAIKNSQDTDISTWDNGDLSLLEDEGLVNVEWSDFESPIIANLSEKGIAYLRNNPDLKNPSIFEDKKYWITTIISIIALIVAIIALFKD